MNRPLPYQSLSMFIFILNSLTPQLNSTQTHTHRRAYQHLDRKMQAESAAPSPSEANDDQVRSWVETYLNPNPLTAEIRDEAAKSIESHRPTLAFLPGTGLQSGALAHAYSARGFSVIIGSRSAEKAAAHAARLAEKTGSEDVRGAELEEAARGGDVVFWLVPTTSEEAWRESIVLLKKLEPYLQGKILIDVTNILWFHDHTFWGQTSSTTLIAAALSPTSTIRLASAFKHTYYRLLTPGTQPGESDDPHSVFVCADHAPTAAKVIALVDRLGCFRGLYAGGVEYTRIVELLSPLWLAQLERDNYGTLFRAGWRFGPGGV